MSFNYIKEHLVQGAICVYGVAKILRLQRNVQDAEMQAFRR